MCDVRKDTNVSASGILEHLSQGVTLFRSCVEEEEKKTKSCSTRWQIGMVNGFGLFFT